MGMEFLYQFFIIVVLVALACTKVTLQGRVSRRFVRNSADTLLFNAQIFTVIAVMMVLLFDVQLPDATCLVFAVACAVPTTLFQTLYTVAMRIGPVSLTVLITSFSVLFTTAASVIFFDEDLYIAQIFGIMFLVASMVLSRDKKSGEKKGDGKWLTLTLISLAASTFATLMLKFFGAVESNLRDPNSTFLCVMYALGALLAYLICLVMPKFGKLEKSTFGFNPIVIIFSVIIGVVLGLFQRLNIYGITTIDGTFFFPTYSGMQSLVMSVIGVLMFKDKLSTRQKLGIACGIVSIVLMNMRFGLHL